MSKNIFVVLYIYAQIAIKASLKIFIINESHPSVKKHNDPK